LNTAFAASRFFWKCADWRRNSAASRSTSSARGLRRAGGTGSMRARSSGSPSRREAPSPGGVEGAGR
jgi:hypothetical protein